MLSPTSLSPPIDAKPLTASQPSTLEEIGVGSGALDSRFSWGTNKVLKLKLIIQATAQSFSQNLSF